ncbi:hypothetical protein OR571_05550 [Psychrobacillus sp. NEAU-3TGS]|uniref:hypothetical protein n=1 Tax=Psychrobacillus sp. NEAU-3TGS TaxID=2995412 RepID=UPI002496FE52|nr:hypothetical protein [Psychrobacillus sp. NEAU-3TGS]MDI2586611.1 hypothetical protein [Psychrobacillus sp. NEAU-3TGS]
MKLIEDMIQELTDTSQEWNNDEISFEVRNMKLDLLINQVEQLQIQFSNPLENLPPDATNVYTQLLSRHKYKAIIRLNELKQASTKRQYNIIARSLIQRKLYFPSLHRSFKRNIWAYSNAKKMLHVKDFQIFIIKEMEGVINE